MWPHNDSAMTKYIDNIKLIQYYRDFENKLEPKGPL